MPKSSPPKPPMDNQLGWITYLPAPFIPYAELTRIHIFFAIPLACWQTIIAILYALAIAPQTSSNSPPILRASLALCLSSYLCHCFAVAWNDTADQDLDRKTPRCKNRPVARGEISTLSATTFALSLVYIAYLPLGHLGVPFSPITLYLSAGVIVLTAAYPFTKRLTDYPQVFLAAGYACVFFAAARGIHDLYRFPDLHLGNENENELESSLLLSGIFSSTYILPTTLLATAIGTQMIFFDIIYALGDTTNDIHTGVGSMAVRYRHNIPGLLSVLTGIIVTCLVGAGWSTGFGRAYFGLVLGVGGALARKVSLVRGWQGLGEEERGVLCFSWHVPVAVGFFMGALGVA
ncbi:UbiA prenyltransferase family-domain-containing protein [Aspergillus californicus]